MRRRRDYQAGETLVEILVALVIIGLIVSAYLATYSTGALASKAHRDLVTADGVLRSYAESVKDAVRDPINGCGKANPTTFTMPASSVPGFNVVATSTLSPVNACPSTAGPPLLNELTLTVTTPGSVTKQLVIDVRTP